jgi:hypothetical protein
MTSRNHPAVFWATIALFVVLVGYPLSFGPACWVVSRTDVGTEWLPYCYRPIVSGLSNDRARLAAIIQWYSRLGAARGWTWVRDGIPISDDHWLAVEWVWMRYP